jgi:hypothetical protein
VLAHPAERQGAKHRDGFIGGGGGAIGLEDIGPDDGAAVEDVVGILLDDGAAK